MNEASRWRFALAERIAASYARNPKTAVIMVAGSVGRGAADRYSDIEIDVYYWQPPTEEERVAAVGGCGAALESLGEDADEWAEGMLFDGFYAHTSTFLISTMERYLNQVVDRQEVAPLAQVRLYSLQHAIPLQGIDRVAAWRAKAAHYPDGLVAKMLAQNLSFNDFWYGAEMLAARNDLILLYETFVQAQRQIIGALLGLNRIYLPAPDPIKGLEELVASMARKPADLAGRLRSVFRLQPVAGARLLGQLIEETFDQVETHVPGFDVAPYRPALQLRRRAWDASPLDWQGGEPLGERSP